MKKLLIATLFATAATAALAAAPIKDTPHGQATPFTVEAGNNCYGLTHYSNISKCGPDKIYYIGGDQNMESNSWCTYDSNTKQWQETPDGQNGLVAGNTGYYACITG